MEGVIDGNLMVIHCIFAVESWKWRWRWMNDETSFFCFPENPETPSRRLTSEGGAISKETVISETIGQPQQLLVRYVFIISRAMPNMHYCMHGWCIQILQLLSPTVSAAAAQIFHLQPASHNQLFKSRQLKPLAGIKNAKSISFISFLAFPVGNFPISRAKQVLETFVFVHFSSHLHFTSFCCDRFIITLDRQKEFLTTIWFLLTKIRLWNISFLLNRKTFASLDTPFTKYLN